MRLNSKLNVLLLFSMIVSIFWLFSKIISLFVQIPVMDNVYDPFIMIVCPCMYTASMMEIFIRRIDDKIPYLITWSFSKEEEKKRKRCNTAFGRTGTISTNSF